MAAVACLQRGGEGQCGGCMATSVSHSLEQGRPLCSACFPSTPGQGTKDPVFCPRIQGGEGQEA